MINVLNYINIITIFAISCLLIINIVLILKYRKMQEEYYEIKSEYLFKANQISMIEYHYRNFKEGKNPYTVIRDISNVLYNGLRSNNTDDR